MLEAKKTDTFIEQTNFTTNKKNLAHRGKSIRCLRKKRIVWKTMTLLKNTKNFLWKQNRFEKGLQIPRKKCPQHCLKQWPAAKTYDSLWKPILLLKRPSNCKEKTPTALSYKMLEAKKTNTFIEKSNWTLKNQ